MRKSGGRGQANKGRWFILTVLLLIFTIYGLFYVNQVVKPSIASVGETRARAMLSSTVSRVIREQFTPEISSYDLLDIKTDAAGRVTLVQADSVAMNHLSYTLAAEIQSSILELETEKVLVPIGTILGSPILSQTGPKVNVKVLPLGTTKICFKTELSEAGINQTKYKVYLEVINKAKVLVPFTANDIQVETTLLVAEAIILGEMPDSYIYVPKDDILDATQLD